MRDYLKKIWMHLWLFLLVEIVFVVIIFREFPPFNLLTLAGILHTSYWIVVLIAWLIRNSIQELWKKIVITYFPIVFHVVIHIYMWIISIEDMHEHGIRHENELLRIVIGSLVAWFIIWFWEYLLHQKEKLEDHHRLYHADEDCDTIDL